MTAVIQAAKASSSGCGTALYAELPRVELREKDGFSYEGFRESDLTLKEYVWQQCEDQIFAALKVEALPRRLSLATVTDVTATPTTSTRSDSESELSVAFPLSFLNGVDLMAPDFTTTNKSTRTPSDDKGVLFTGPPRLDSLRNGNRNISQHKNGLKTDSSTVPPLPPATTTTTDTRRASFGEQKRRHHRRSPSTQLEWMQQDVYQASQRLKLLDKMAQVQRQYLQMADRKTVFHNLLTAMLELMESDYGFIGEVIHENDNDGNQNKNSSMYLQSYAISNVDWDAATRKEYRDKLNSPEGLKYSTQSTSVFGSVVTDRKPIISNSPQDNPRYQHCSCETTTAPSTATGQDTGTDTSTNTASSENTNTDTASSENTNTASSTATTNTQYLGHPPVLRSFLGLPIFDNTTTRMNGVIILANTRRLGGYTTKDIEFLEPIVALCGNLMQAYQKLKPERASEDEKLYELELANVQLAQAHQKVLRQNAMQLQHFACASHEIRTPLNCIIGLSSLLQETELNPMQAESMQLISSSSELLLTVVNDVLDYSKLESGHVTVTLQPSNLQETLMGVVQSMELKTRGKNIRVRTEYSPSLPPLWKTDRLRLQQILFNLLGNAFKFSPPDSCIDLKVQLGPPNRPSVAAHAVPLRVPRVLRFIVQDYGCGIQPDQLENVFQPFVQAGDDNHRLYEGTGLGLAITSKLVQALGGCVYANSAVGVGSEFCMEFPYDHEEFDVEAMTKRLDNTTVLLVPGRNLPEDRLPVFERILDSYQIDYRVFASMDDLGHVVLQPSSNCSMGDLSNSSSQSEEVSSDESNHTIISLPGDRSYICLVDEAVYEREIWQHWKQHPCPSVLLTFGPDYAVAETSNHYRDLLQILPSVLMQSLADSIEDAKASKTTNPKGRRQGTTKFKKPSRPKIPVREKHDVSILIVEDNVINQKVLMALLKKIGYTRVSVVGDGSLAVDAVEHNKFDVILMDVQMPVMDGLEATRIICERHQEKFVEGDKSPAPKIVFVTASVDQELEEEATNLGAVGFVPKPFNLRQLETCMTEICRSLG